MITLYNVVSADGYIAKKDGSEDFIPDSYWKYTLNTLKQYDLIVLGRKTYETMQKYDKELLESFEALPVRKVVLTKQKDFYVKDGYETVDTPEKLTSQNLNIVVTSGPTLNQYLLDNNLVDRIIYHEVPESIGDGIKPYRSTGTIKGVRLSLN
jgi:dihydrofolate reductase